MHGLNIGYGTQWMQKELNEQLQIDRAGLEAIR
jgi:hypothetical protein